MGFTQKMLKELMEQLTPLVRDDPPIDDTALRKLKGATFVEPELVCEVEYLEYTKSTGKMRAPSFLVFDPTRHRMSACSSRPPSTRSGRSADD